jgi:hypothetical protein
LTRCARSGRVVGDSHGASTRVLSCRESWLSGRLLSLYRLMACVRTAARFAAVEDGSQVEGLRWV